jgi:hypothetical protein
MEKSPIARPTSRAIFLSVMGKFSEPNAITPVSKNHPAPAKTPRGKNAAEPWNLYPINYCTLRGYFSEKLFVARF